MEPALLFLTSILLMLTIALTGLLIWGIYRLAKVIKNAIPIVSDMKVSTFGIALALGLGAHGRGFWVWLFTTVAVVYVLAEGYFETRQKAVPLTRQTGSSNPPPTAKPLNESRGSYIAPSNSLPPPPPPGWRPPKLDSKLSTDFE